MFRPWLTALMVTLLAARVSAATRVLHVFTDADAVPVSTEHAKLTITPLYGGSDRSAFNADLSQLWFQTGEKFPPVTVVDAPVTVIGPAVLTGRLSGDVPDRTYAFDVLVSVADAAGHWSSLGRVPLPRIDTDHEVPPVRIPVPFDPAHPPARVRVQIAIGATDGVGQFSAKLSIANLKLVDGDGPPPPPALAPTADPSPAWPPTDVVHGIGIARAFRGDDFDPSLYRNNQELNPVRFLPGQGENFAVLVSSRPAGDPRTIPLIAVDEPGVPTGNFAVTGTVQYAGAGDANDVDGFGYLELLADYAAGPPTATRTLAGSGPLRAFTGHSGTRPFALAVVGDPKPTRVRVNLVMSGTGLITLGELKLVTWRSGPSTEPSGSAAGSSAGEPTRSAKAEPAANPPGSGRSHSGAVARGPSTPSIDPANLLPRLFTDADVPTPSVDVGSNATKLVPLYGGSDRSAYVVTHAQSQLVHGPGPLPPPLRFTLADVAVELPADAAVAGRVWADRNYSFSDGDPPGAKLEVQVAGPDGAWATTASTALADADGPAADVRLPAHAAGSRRVRVQLVLPYLLISPMHINTVVAGLRLTTADAAPITTPTPAAQSSVKWPPAGTREAVVRQFAGNDFNAQLAAQTANGQASLFAADTSIVNPVSLSPATDPLGVSGLKVDVRAPVTDGLRTIPLVAVDDPDVTAARFAVAGTVAYGGVGDAPAVDGFAYLELVSDFADGPSVTTRTLAASGPTRLIAGRSGARPFALPVNSGNRRPTRVRLTLVTSGRASVELTGLSLVQADPVPTTAPVTVLAGPSTSLPWWAVVRTRTAVGTFALLAAIGVAAAVVHRGPARPFAWAAAIVGQAYFGCSMAVVGRGGPPSAWGPLLACGVVGLAVPAVLPTLARRARDAELRRMRAMDAVAA